MAHAPTNTPWQIAAHRVYSTGDAVRLVRAAPADAAELTAVALAAKRHWDYPLRWLELWRSDLTIQPEFIANPAHTVVKAQRGAQTLSFYALACAAEQAALEHLWVLPAAMGQGVGRMLFQHAMQEARRRGATALAITADPNAEGFYLRMGARRVGEKRYLLEGRPRVLPLLVCDIA